MNNNFSKELNFKKYTNNRKKIMEKTIPKIFSVDLFIFIFGLNSVLTIFFIYKDLIIAIILNYYFINNLDQTSLHSSLVIIAEGK